jgi:hypothetical protein
MKLQIEQRIRLACDEDVGVGEQSCKTARGGGQANAARRRDGGRTCGAKRCVRQEIHG